MKKKTEEVVSTPETFVSVDDLKKDEFIINSLAVLEKPGLQIDSSLEKELKAMFRAAEPGATLWKLPKTIDTIEDLAPLIEAHVEAQAYRDRIFSIKLDLIAVFRKLDRLKTNIEAWLYKWDAISGLRSEHIRAVTISSIIEPLDDRYELCSDLLKICDTVLKYLENLHFTMLEIKEIGQTIIDERRARTKEM